jgi:pyridoxal phosphate enzyme (YggS family)
MKITENYKKILQEIPKQINLVVVTKFQEKESILEVYKNGHRDFGENKVQEIIRKREFLPKDIKWHMIGHLQTNKVKSIIPYVSMIHSVDSLNLLKEINKQALKSDNIINCLLQFYIAKEETKYGLNIEEAELILESEEIKNFNNIKICGVMGMGSFTENKNLVRKEFKELVTIFNKLKDNYFKNDIFFKDISMGMSNDYDIGIEEGSTILRIGSKIFQ